MSLHILVELALTYLSCPGRTGNRFGEVIIGCRRVARLRQVIDAMPDFPAATRGAQVAAWPSRRRPWNNTIAMPGPLL